MVKVRCLEGQDSQGGQVGQLVKMVKVIWLRCLCGQDGQGGEIYIFNMLKVVKVKLIHFRWLRLDG